MCLARDIRMIVYRRWIDIGRSDIMLIGEIVDWRAVRRCVRGVIRELRREEILVVSVEGIRPGELVLAVDRAIRVGEPVLMVGLLWLRL